MTKLEVEVFSEQTNAAVIRMPGRKFPGIVVQGDSLKIMLESVKEIAELLQDAQIPSLAVSAEELVQLQSAYTEAYEQALKLHSYPLPY